MKKVLTVIGIIVVVLLAIGAWWVYYVPAPAVAILYIEEGAAEVDLGQGWIAAQDEMELAQGAKVRTGKDGAASVVLLEGEVVHLEPNTEITLSEITDTRMRIKQLAGETWNKITRISGIMTFEVETPNTVATVRGTELMVKVGDEEDEVAVGEGEAEVGFVKTPSKKLVVGAMRRVRMQAALDTITEETLAADDPRLAKFREKYVKHLQRVRLREIRRHKQLLRMAQKRYGVDEEQMNQFLREVDEGKKDEDALYRQLPGVLKKKAERAYKITKAIKKAKQAMRP